MRKVLLVLSTILLLSSFTNITNNTIVLKDIDGTLLKSYVEINKVDGEYIATFTVDANTVVTSNTVDGATKVYLVENGTSNTTVTHTIAFKNLNIAFDHYLANNFDLAYDGNMLASATYVSERPKKLGNDNEQ